MPSLSFMLRKLGVALLLGMWILGADADMVHSSCRDMKQWTEDGDLESFGDVSGKINKALKEAYSMTSNAKNTMVDMEEGDIDKPGFSRALGPFLGLWGDIRRPLDSSAWDHLYRNIKTIKEHLKNRHNESPVIICGDAHLERYSLLKGDIAVKSPKEKDKKNVIGFVFWDPIVSKWWKDNEQACIDSPARAQVERGTYIMVCAAGVSRPDSSTTIGSQRNTNWGLDRYRETSERSLDYWSDFLSYTLLHEFLHILFDWHDHRLQSPIHNYRTGRPLGTAYGYFGSAALLAQRPHKVASNVDSTGMFILALFMDRSDWASGYATIVAPVCDDYD